MEIQFALVHYNTPGLTAALLRSIRLYHPDSRVTILDNSDEYPFPAPSADSDTVLLDNTSGQLIDFDKVLSAYPSRDPGDGTPFASAKHAISVQYLIDTLDAPFVLLDSDVLLRRPLDGLVDPSVCCVAGVQHDRQPRIYPFVAYINVPLVRSLGIRFFDGNRMYRVCPPDSPGYNYDTGASFYEDVGPSIREIDYTRYVEHYGNGSWRNDGQPRAGSFGISPLSPERWLSANRDLYDPSFRGKFRFHVLGNPNTLTSPEFSSCAFTQKALRFCRMMAERGHEVYHYGVEGSCPVCTEDVPVLSLEEFREHRGEPDPSKPASTVYDDETCRKFYRNAVREISARAGRRDFLLPFLGNAHRPVCDLLPDIVTVEPGIGYWGSFAKYRIYESYAWRNCQLGDVKWPSFYDAVIPNYYDPAEFPWKETPDGEPYLLFVGRVCESKGVYVAMDVAAKIGVKLVVAGDMYEDVQFRGPVEYVGHVGPSERSRLMAGASALMVPSLYSEPFGSVCVEGLLSGTPLITTDWGAFPEINVDGVTGYRCRTFRDFVKAARDCIGGKISRRACRSRGEEYSFDRIAPRYEKYFADLRTLYDDPEGWYAE